MEPRIRSPPLCGKIFDASICQSKIQFRHKYEVTMEPRIRSPTRNPEP